MNVWKKNKGRRRQQKENEKGGKHCERCSEAMIDANKGKLLEEKEKNKRGWMKNRDKIKT